MPVLRPADSSPRSGSADDPHHLALCCLGPRPRRASSKGACGFTHSLVTIDKFSKCIEVRPITRIKAEQAVLFFTDIIHRFGVPNSIITDNDTQFTGRTFLEFCDRHHICVDWATVAHPKTNGQVERANGMILQGLKPRIFNRLDMFGKRWLKELLAVIWSLRSSRSRATGFTPFFMVYGSEAILPTDLEYGSPRVQAYDENSYKMFQEDVLDQLDEARDVALLHSDKVPTGSPPVPRATSPRPSLSSRQLGAEAQTKQQGSSQAHAPLGRTLRHRRSPPTRHLQARQQNRAGLQERVEHRTTMSLLSLELCKNIHLFMSKE